MAKNKGICDETCKGCVFCGYLNGQNLFVCNYFLATNKRRPCPAGSGCTVKQKGKKKTTWQREADQTWQAKKKKEKAVLHKVCPCCGVEFETTDPRKIFCSRRCNQRIVQRQRYKKIREATKKAKMEGFNDQ